MSDSIDETAGTPSVLLAAVTLSMRQQVHPLFRWPQLSRTAARLLCVLRRLPRNWQGSARWYQVRPYASTYPTLKPRLFERSESNTKPRLFEQKKNYVRPMVLVLDSTVRCSRPPARNLHLSSSESATCKRVLWCSFQTVQSTACLLYTSPSPRDKRQSRMPSSA